MKKKLTLAFVCIATITLAQQIKKSTEQPSDGRIGQYSKLTNPQEENKQAEFFCKAGEQSAREKKYDEAYTNYSKAIKVSSTAKYYCKRGSLLMLQNKYDEASADFNSAIKQNPNYSEAYFLKAVVYQFSNKTTEAIDYYSKAINVNLNYTDAYLMRGLLYATIKKKNQACNDLNKAVLLGSVKAKKHLQDICGG